MPRCTANGLDYFCYNIQRPFELSQPENFYRDILVLSAEEAFK